MSHSRRSDGPLAEMAPQRVLSGVIRGYQSHLISPPQGGGNRIHTSAHTFHGTQDTAAGGIWGAWKLNSCLASGNLFFSMALLQGWGAAAAACTVPGSVWDPGFSGSWQEQPMEAEEWPVVMEPSVFCPSWKGDPGKKRAMQEIWGFFSSSFRFRALFQACPQRGMQSLCPDFGTFKLCFAIGWEGIKFLELDSSLFSLGASQGFSIHAISGIMERCVQTERRWLG